MIKSPQQKKKAEVVHKKVKNQVKQPIRGYEDEKIGQTI
jgi:hypothetical protein